MHYGRHDEFEDETRPEQWADIANLAAKGDAERLMDRLFDIGTIDPRAAGLLVLAKSEHARLLALVEAAKGSGNRAGELQRELEFAYRSATAVDPETASKRCGDIEREIAELRTKTEHARIASIHASGIVQRFPQLFGAEPVGEGDRAHWPPVSNSPSPAMHNELNRLGLSSTAIDPWRFFAPVAMPTKKPKRMVSPLTIGDEE